MKTILPFFKILRPGNALMAGATVVLGFWLSGSRLPALSLVHLIIVAVCAVGYGNVVNDVLDVMSDRVSHPTRPLPSNEMTLISATVLAFFLCTFSIVNAFIVSTPHGAGAVAPLALLSLYAFFLKGTPLAGNIVVSLLVAYTIIFGGLMAPHSSRLIVPALLAFLLNFAREIVKDLQDEAGDTAAGVTTTAVLPKPSVKAIILGISLVYMMMLFLPFVLKQFGFVYCILCAAFALPLHCYWSVLMIRPTWEKSLAKISLFIKIEMIAGLLALAADQAYFLIR